MEQENGKDITPVQLPSDMSEEEYKAIFESWGKNAPLQTLCPNCGEEIHSLREIGTTYYNAHFEVLPSGDFRRESFEASDEPLTVDCYVCTQCTEEVAQTREEAIKLFMGGQDGG